jgi:hypothetical protein
MYIYKKKRAKNCAEEEHEKITNVHEKKENTKAREKSCFDRFLFKKKVISQLLDIMQKLSKPKKHSSLKRRFNNSPKLVSYLLKRHNFLKSRFKKMKNMCENRKISIPEPPLSRTSVVMSDQNAKKDTKFYLNDILDSTIRVINESYDKFNHCFYEFLPHDSSILIYLSLLRDKSYHLYNEYAISLLSTKLTQQQQTGQLKNSGLNIENLFNHDLKQLICYLTHLPGFLACDQKDLENMLSENLLSIYALITFKLYFSDEETLIVLNDSLICIREWLERTIGAPVLKVIENIQKTVSFLGISDCEFALLLPFILTQSSKIELRTFFCF